MLLNCLLNLNILQRLSSSSRIYLDLCQVNDFGCGHLLFEIALQSIDALKGSLNLCLFLVVDFYSRHLRNEFYVAVVLLNQFREGTFFIL